MYYYHKNFTPNGYLDFNYVQVLINLIIPLTYYWILKFLVKYLFHIYTLI